MLKKTCNRCGEEKDIARFYRDAHKSDGRTSTCKNCLAIERQRKATAADYADRVLGQVSDCQNLM